jgi:hypothetical protein
MLPDTTRQRLAALLAPTRVDLAYHVHPLPKGVVSAARGGLALLFAATTTPNERYDQSQRLRFQLMGLLPPGHAETILLNDSRLGIAAAVVAQGTVVYSRDEGQRLRYEMLVLSQELDFAATMARLLGG